MGTTLIQPSSSTTAASSGDSTPRVKAADLSGKGPDKAIMATSFLQYCAMCEKQIMTPCNSILYCSESCRKKDDAKPLSASMLPVSYLSASAPTSPSRESSPESPRSPYTSTPVVRLPTDNHDFKSDLDPTEWKPKLPRGHSEAYLYLSKFHAKVNAGGDEYVRVDRPRYGHKHTVSMTTTPSLGTTPTTAASSFDSMLSLRPLNARTDPMYAISSAAKSADLVTPHIVPATERMTWEKKVVVRDPAGTVVSLLSEAK